MALHDVDKSGDNRSNPIVNSHDEVLKGAHKAHQTISSHYDAGADSNTGRLQMLNKQIIGYDGTTPITLYGYNQALNQWGFFVTKAGVDVTTNTDLSQFIFNSSQDVFKIVLTGSTTVSPGTINAGTSNTTTIPHGLSNTPAFLAYVQMPSGGGTYFGGQGLTNVPSHMFLSGGTCAMVVQASVDSTNLYLQLINPTGSNINWTGFSWTFKYYLLQETAN